MVLGFLGEALRERHKLPLGGSTTLGDHGMWSENHQGNCTCLTTYIATELCVQGAYPEPEQGPEHDVR